MVDALVILQILLILTQLYIGISAIVKKENPFEYCKGYAVWVCIPIITIHLIVNAIT